MTNGNDVVNMIVGRMSDLERQIFEGYQSGNGMQIATMTSGIIAQKHPGSHDEEFYAELAALKKLKSLSYDQLLHIISATEAADVFIAEDGNKLVLPPGVISQFYGNSVSESHSLEDFGKEGREFLAHMYLKQMYGINLGPDIGAIIYAWKEACKIDLKA